MSTSQMVHKTIRIHQSNAAFVYAILESLEGMTAYTTKAKVTGSMNRDIELWISPDFTSEMEQVLEGLRKKFPVLELGLTCDDC